MDFILKILQNVGDSALCTFSQTCCNIETLDLSSCKKLSDKTFHCLAQHCTKLATLNISSCSNLTDTSLRAIGHGCPQLTSLNLSWCELITQAGIALIAGGCRRLKTFISKVGPACYLVALAQVRGQLVVRVMSLWPSPDQGWQHITTATTPRTNSFYANPNLYNRLISDLCSVGL